MSVHFQVSVYRLDLTPYPVTDYPRGPHLTSNRNGCGSVPAGETRLTSHEAIVKTACKLAEEPSEDDPVLPEACLHSARTNLSLV